MSKIELDYMEYPTDELSRAAYVSSEPIVPLTGDLLDEDCAGIDDWADGDKGVGVSEVDPAGQFRFDTNASAAGDDYAYRTIDIGSFPDTYTFEIKLYHDTLGTKANTDCLQIYCSALDEMFRLEFGTDGLFINDTDSGYTEVGSNLVKSGASKEWQIWRFLVDSSGALGDATCDVYLTDSTHNAELVGDDIPCSQEGATNDGLLQMILFGYTTDDMVTHIDYIKIANGLVVLVPNLQCYSEDTIIQQGTYSLKVVAAKDDSLNDTLTKSGLLIDLSDRDSLKLHVRADRTGSNIQARLYDSVGGWITKDVNVTSTGEFIEITWDISGVANANKSNITKIEFKIINADSATVYYIDNFYAPEVVIANTVFFGINF